MPFACSICEAESTRICMCCTKDTCANHLCVRCECCSDCCACEVPLEEPMPEVPAVHAAAPPEPEPRPEPPHPPPDPDPFPVDEPEPGVGPPLSPLSH